MPKYVDYVSKKVYNHALLIFQLNRGSWDGTNNLEFLNFRTT